MADIALDEVAAIVAGAAKLARDLQDGELNVREKTPGHQVCDADLAVDRYLHEHLAALDPDAGFLSEESLDDQTRLDCERVWVIDPIDGTRDYIRGRPGWCVAVALVEDGQPVLGVLDAPLQGEVWCAEAGQGATLNGEAIRCNAITDMAGARIPAVDLPKTPDNLVAVEKPNSIALRIGMVAADKADIVASTRWGGEWDVAAAALIAREAGATITDAFGEPLGFNTQRGQAFGLAVAPPGIHARLLERLRERAEKDASNN